MPILIHVVHKDVFLSWCLTYLRLIEARSLANRKALHLLATTDLISLDLLLGRVFAAHTRIRPRQALQVAQMVSADLDS